MSWKGVFASPAAYFGLAVTEGSFAPCLTSRARAASAPSNTAPAPAAPSLRNSRRLNQSALGVISDDRTRAILPPAQILRRTSHHGFVRPKPEVEGLGSQASGLSRFGLAHDGRHGRRELPGRRLGRRRLLLALDPRVPALARQPLLLGRQLGAVLVADESGPRPARAVRAAFHAAAHVERAPRARLLGRQADDPLRRHGGGQLALGSQAAIALEDALLLDGGELPGVLLAEPAIAWAGPWLAATRDRAEPARAPSVGALHAAGLGNLEASERRRHLRLDLRGDGRGQLAGEMIYERAKGAVLGSLRHGSNNLFVL